MNPYFSGGGGDDGGYSPIPSAPVNDSSYYQQQHDTSSNSYYTASAAPEYQQDYNNSNPYANPYAQPASNDYYSPSHTDYNAASTGNNDIVSQHIQRHDEKTASTNANIQNMAASAAKEAAIAAGVIDAHPPSTPPPAGEDGGGADDVNISIDDADNDTLAGTTRSLTNIEDADRQAKKIATARAKRAGSPNGANGEVSAEQKKRLQEVDSISHRWRVRAIYDDIGTAAPAAPDALSTFLKLRADMLRPSTEVVRLKEARRKEEKEAKRVAEIEKRRLERAQARERRLRQAPGSNPALERHNTFASSRSLGVRSESQHTIGGGGANGNSAASGGGIAISASDISDDDQGDDALTDNENEYDEDFLKAELHRALEQLQKAHSDAQNLQAQNSVMSKELRVRQKKINELEDWNHDLLEQNRELERTVHELRSAAIDDDQAQQQQQNDHLQVQGGRHRVGSKPPVSMKMSRNVSQRSHISNH